jgi:hypothetical protein
VPHSVQHAVGVIPLPGAWRVTARLRSRGAGEVDGVSVNVRSHPPSTTVMYWQSHNIRRPLLLLHRCATLQVGQGSP